MTNVIYFDCPTGISGDMALAALVDLGLDLDQLRAGLAGLGLQGWSIEARQLTSHGISGTQLQISADDTEQHRRLSDILALIAASTLPAAVKQRSAAIFQRLGEAEAAVHGVPVDNIHFHEVGAIDSILDIVGFALGLHLLEIDELYASPLPLGSGWIDTAHGRLPVPAPATLRLLAEAGAPTRADDDLRGELVTPTGAVLLAACAVFERPQIALRRIGYGFGKRDIGRANAVRAWFGTRQATTQEHPPASAILLEANLDDQPGEQLAYVAEQLMSLGALDVWFVPVLMKKGRPAVVLSALVSAEDEDQAAALIFRETTTLGLRRRVSQRLICQRTIRSVDTELGAIRVKEKRWRGELLGIAPEYEDCARLARQHQRPLREIYDLALRAAHV